VQLKSTVTAIITGIIFFIINLPIVKIATLVFVYYSKDLNNGETEITKIKILNCFEFYFSLINITGILKMVF